MEAFDIGLALEWLLWFYLHGFTYLTSCKKIKANYCRFFLITFRALLKNTLNSKVSSVRMKWWQRYNFLLPSSSSFSHLSSMSGQTFSIFHQHSQMLYCCLVNQNSSAFQDEVRYTSHTCNGLNFSLILGSFTAIFLYHENTGDCVYQGINNCMGCLSFLEQTCIHPISIVKQE